MPQLSLVLLVLARPVPVMSRGWEWRPDNLSQVPGGKQGGVWMFDSQSEAKQYPPRPLLPGWNIWPYHWSADHIWRSFHPGVSLHDGPTEKTPFEREMKSLRPNFKKPSPWKTTDVSWVWLNNPWAPCLQQKHGFLSWHTGVCLHTSWKWGI